ncbi:ferrochelatase [Sphingomonas sp. SRS2]|uniref:ferrochelatase n=1 Tax=Sphingomonas sp. SRS2 TaxID=133190 RepID=UPI0006184590|nr:ferrochelatase [Sphingomonas sp. SRS2]KKC27521.1 ferrochelatase [Sphingomonas sp. SRS2]
MSDLPAGPAPVPASPAGHPPVLLGKIGILLVNLGTPDAPTAAAVRRYLAEFLSDRRVIEIPPLLWQPILRGIILNTRPKKSAHAYSQVWTEEGSPLAAITARQAAALRAHLGESHGERVIVDHAMRYGRPSIAERITALKAQGCDRILVAPLYPQYCGATTASVNDAVFAALAGMRWQPALRTLPPYHDHPAYIDALTASIRQQLAGLDFVPDAIVASFHGMPRRTLDLGDPYHCHCQKTARLLSAALGRQLIVCFQSRFGRARWLEPSTEATFERLGREGVRRIAVVAPGFAADCLETLEELAIRGREQFMSAGGERFAYLHCLNDSAPGMAMLEDVIAGQLGGWIEAGADSK